MSKINQTITLLPPEYPVDRPEVIISEAIPCNCCKGSGFFWNLDNEEKTSCSFCKGTGKVRARVVIEWE